MSSSGPTGVPAGSLQSGASQSGAMAVPIKLVNLSPASPREMEVLIQSGESLPPLISARYLAYSRLTHAITRSSGTPWPIDNSAKFSQRDGKMFVYALWLSASEIKGKATLQFFTPDNKPVDVIGPIKELKANLKPGKRTPTYWQVDVTRIPPGDYRVDILFNGEPAGRARFRITNE
jgi:hypothetical protein